MNETPTNSRDLQPFVTELIGAQPRLRGLLLALLASHAAVDDVLQETNVVLWSKRDEFELGTNFWAWSAKVAYFQVLKFRKKQARDRHEFDDELLSDLAAEVDKISAAREQRYAALKRCIEKLPPEQRLLIEQRYAGQRTVADISESLGRPATSLYTALYRILRALLECVNDRQQEVAPS